MSQLASLRREIKKLASAKRAKTNAWFFKTGKGEYGEGDKFVGLTVPNTRKIAKQFRDLSFTDITKLLKSKIHEERLIALLILVSNYEKGDNKARKTIFDFYLKNTKRVNNWDLVDSSAHYIVGAHLENKSRKLLERLAKSKDLWERRIAIIATYRFIKQNDFKDTLEISEILLQDENDLIHKAVGWMLREVGNRDKQALTKFLKPNYKKMPRTMLRYAIEKFPEQERQRYLKGRV